MIDQRRTLILEGPNCLDGAVDAIAYRLCATEHKRNHRAIGVAQGHRELGAIREEDPFGGEEEAMLAGNATICKSIRCLCGFKRAKAEAGGREADIDGGVGR